MGHGGAPPGSFAPVYEGRVTAAALPCPRRGPFTIYTVPSAWYDARRGGGCPGRESRQVVRKGRPGMKIVACNSNRPLAEAVAASLGLPQTRATIPRIADHEVLVEINEKVRGADV